MISRVFSEFGVLVLLSFDGSSPLMIFAGGFDVFVKIFAIRDRVNFNCCCIFERVN